MTRAKQSGFIARSALKLGRVGRRVLIGLAAISVMAVLLASVAWGVLLLQILPRIDAWRFDLAEQATRALGVPVRIGKVIGRSEGVWPILSFKEVQLLDATGRVALRLPEVTARISLATLSPLALAEGALRLDQLVLVGPELEVRRDPSGDLHVAGLKLSGAAGQGGSSSADWVLSQSQIKISRGTVRWTDELRHAPTLALSQVDLSLQKLAGIGRRKHELTLEATPPPEFGRRFKVMASMAQPLWQASGVPVKAGQSVPWWLRWELDATRPSQWQTWSGTIFASLPYVDVQRLKQHVSLPIDVEGGRGAVAGELSLDSGLPSGLKVDVAVQDVNVRLSKQLRPLAFRRLQGQVIVKHEAELSTLSFNRLAFVLNEGLVWPASSGKLTWRHAVWPEGLSDAVWGLTRGGEVQADRLDLALLAKLVDRLPVAPAVRATLADVAPHGVIERLAWQWDGLLERPDRYKASARIKGLGWAASDTDGRPGIDQADVTVSADETGGHADLAVNHGWVGFPGLFEEAKIPLTSLQARVNWSVKPSAVKGLPSDWLVDVTNARFANEDTTGQLEGHWRTGTSKLSQNGKAMPRFPGWLSLTGRLDRAEVSRVWRYLPLAIPKAPRDYVRYALRSGQGHDVSFDVDGDLSEFPFKDNVGGRFRVKVPMQNVSLDYAPVAMQAGPAAAKVGGWPAFTSLDGLLLFEGQRMLIKEAHGRLGDVGSGRFGLRNVEGRIDDFGQNDPRLTISGQGEGPLSDMLRFLSLSPIGRWTGDVMGRSQSSGTAAMTLALDIPLDHAQDTRLKGAVTLVEGDHANLRLNPGVPQFAALQGKIAFTETDLSVTARTRVWGHQVAVDGRRTADGVTKFVAQGAMSAEGLRQAEEFPLLQRLAQRLTGESPVSVTVSMGRSDANGGQANPEVQVTSTLQGMAANLPAPLNKSAQAIWPIKVTHRQDDAQGRSDAITVDLGNPQAGQIASANLPWLLVDLRRDTSGDLTKVTRGAINLIQSVAGGATAMMPLPSKGVAAQAVVPVLDLDAWSAVARLFRSDASAGVSADPVESYLPDSLSIKTGALTIQQRTLKDVSGTLAHPAPNVWRAQIESQQVAGQIEWVPETAPLATGPGSSRVIARLSRLSVPNADAQALEDQVTDHMLSAEASTLPALDIVIDQFEWRGLPLGRVEVEALNRLVPVAGAAPLPEWRMTKFRIATPEAQLHATGNWAALGAQSAASRTGSGRARPRSAFGFTLDLQNSGALLARLGMAQTLKGGKGKMSGQLSWLGSPLEPDPLTMTGDINVQISEGQFLKVDPGMAKLLGVLSLQSLPRRLTLDFRDLFQQGFAFDAIDGDVKVGQGLATTRNLRMRGVQAVVLIEGQADLARETQNLHVFVVPDLNAGGASLAYAAINPVIGLGTFLAQVLLRKQVADAGTQEFKVTGPWADPRVDKVSARPEAAESPASSAATKPRKPS